MSDLSPTGVQAVTGAFGFSGRYIASRLLEKGLKVITLTGSPNRPNPFGGRLETRPYDFGNPERMAESLKDVQVLYNTYWVRFGGQPGQPDPVENNRAILEAARLAGVSRVVHISVANASEDSPYPYYRGKARVEGILKSSGLPYSIVRPAVLFGTEGVLINNMAWTLRRLPVFTIFGDGKYRVCPIYVDDLAKLMVEEGGHQENREIYALGPDDFTYKELVKTIGQSIGRKRVLLPVPVWMGYLGSKVINLLVNDIFVTRDELQALVSGLLHVPGAAPTGTTRLADWARENKNTLGLKYLNETGRHKDKSSVTAY